MLRLAGAGAAADVGAADELVVGVLLSSDFFSSDPHPARARPSTTAMIAIPPALTFVIGSPVSVEKCAMSLRSANARWKGNRREVEAVSFCIQASVARVCPAMLCPPRGISGVRGGRENPFDFAAK